MIPALRTPLSARFIQGWVRVYTCGLDASLREARREEVAADIWEHVQEATARGQGDLAGHMLLRWAGGLFDDLTWRLGHRSARKGAPMLATGSHRGTITAVSALGAILILALIAIQVVSQVEYSRQVDYAITPPWQLILSLYGPAILGSVVGGFVYMRRAPTLGALLVTLGSVAFGVMLFWLIIPGIIALGLSVYAFRRARRLQSGR